MSAGEKLDNQGGSGGDDSTGGDDSIGGSSEPHELSPTRESNDTGKSSSTERTAADILSGVEKIFDLLIEAAPLGGERAKRLLEGLRLGKVVATKEKVVIEAAATLREEGPQAAIENIIDNAATIVLGVFAAGPAFALELVERTGLGVAMMQQVDPTNQSGWRDTYQKDQFY